MTERPSLDRELDRKALEQLRRGDLHGAYDSLSILYELYPEDKGIARRLEQLAKLLQQREDAKFRIQAEPVRYANAYIKAGRLEEALRLLRSALKKDPENVSLRKLTLQVAQKLRQEEEARLLREVPKSAHMDRNRAQLPKRDLSVTRSAKDTEPSNEQLLELYAVLLHRIQTRRWSPQCHFLVSDLT